jgi:hypothetical protein
MLKAMWLKPHVRKEFSIHVWKSACSGLPIIRKHMLCSWRKVSASHSSRNRVQTDFTCISKPQDFVDAISAWMVTV